MDQSIVIAATNATDLEPAPIVPGWILSGKPEAQSKIMAKSKDGTSIIMVWECTPGRFNWHYCEDETVVLIAGEVFIAIGNDPERRLGAGDMAFFPAGSSAIWRITDRVKKVAVLRHALPYPLGFALRAWSKLMRIAGLKSNSPLHVPVLAGPTEA
jgi:uncharacterized protein